MTNNASAPDSETHDRIEAKRSFRRLFLSLSILSGLYTLGCPLWQISAIPSLILFFGSAVAGGAMSESEAKVFMNFLSNRGTAG